MCFFFCVSEKEKRETHHARVVNGDAPEMYAIVRKMKRRRVWMCLMVLLVLPSALIRNSVLAVCPLVASCDEGTAPYRTMDGSCNSLYSPLYGTPYRPYRRLLPAWYADGVSEPARMASGRPLPNARQLSMALFGEAEGRDGRNTIINMQFGQLVAHDMSFTADGKLADGGGGDENGWATRRHWRNW